MCLVCGRAWAESDRGRHGRHHPVNSHACSQRWMAESSPRRRGHPAYSLRPCAPSLAWSCRTGPSEGSHKGRHRVQARCHAPDEVVAAARAHGLLRAQSGGATILRGVSNEEGVPGASASFSTCCARHAHSGPGDPVIILDTARRGDSLTWTHGRSSTPWRRGGQLLCHRYTGTRPVVDLTSSW